MIVKLRGVTKVTKEFGIFLTAIKLNDNLYVTGQEVRPGIRTIDNGLTYEEMTGAKILSEEKAKMFPFIVKPHTIIPFRDGHKFDTDTPEGVANLNFVKSVARDRIAHSKDEFRKGKHEMYIEDKIQESKTKVNRFKLSMKAGNALGRLSPNELLGIADYIYVHENEPACSRDRDIDIIHSTLYDYAEKKPLVLLEAMKDENKSWINVANIITKGILNKKNGEYYEGNIFISTNFESLVELYRTDISKSSRWDKKAEALGKNIYAVETEPSLDIASIKSRFLNAIVIGDKVELDEVSLEIRRSKNAELMALLVSYINKNKVVAPILTNDELLASFEEENFAKARAQFLKAHPNTGLKTKDEFINFLKSE